MKTFNSLGLLDDTDQDNFPLTLITTDGNDSLHISSDKALEFYYLLLLNTCHDCFPETTIVAKEKKGFQLNVVPEDYFKETNYAKPHRPFIDAILLKNVRQKLFSYKKVGKKSLLDDVPVGDFSIDDHTEQGLYIDVKDPNDDSQG